MSNEKKVLQWLAGDNVGQSSQFLAFSFLGIEKEYAHPYDPGDLNRCFQLIKQVPDIATFLPEMASKSKEWEALVESWDELEATFIEEVGENWEKKNKSAKMTYDMMKSLLRED